MFWVRNLRGLLWLLTGLKGAIAECRRTITLAPSAPAF